MTAVDGNASVYQVNLASRITGEGRAHISQLTQLMLAPETCKSNIIGSQSTLCQVQTGAYVSLLAPERTDNIIPLATQERLPRIYYTSHYSRMEKPIMPLAISKRDYHVYIIKKS